MQADARWQSADRLASLPAGFAMPVAVQTSAAKAAPTTRCARTNDQGQALPLNPRRSRG